MRDYRSVHVLGNPKCWLGITYRLILGSIYAVNLTEGKLASTPECLWDDAVGTQYQGARSHPLDHRFGLSVRWPS